MRSADYSVLKDQRLVARIYAGQGVLRRAGNHAPVREIAWADVELFEPRAQGVFEAVLDASESLDAFVFKLRLEEFEVRTGDVRLSSSIKRF